MEKVKKNKEAIFLLVLLLFISIFIIGWLIVTGNSGQAFKDVVVEYTAKVGSNKSAERLLVYLLIALCLLLIFVIYGKYLYTKDNIDGDREYSYYKVIMIGAGFSVIVPLLLYCKCNFVPLIIVLFGLIVYFIDKDKAIDNIILLIVSFYGLAGIYRLLVVLGISFDANKIIIYIAGSLISLIVVILSSKVNNKIYKWMMMIIQMIIPFSLLIFFERSYRYNGKNIIINLPLILSITVVLLVVFALAYNIYNFRINKGLVSIATICCIVNYNRYVLGGAIVRNDMHHPFENIIGYSEITRFGLKPFSQYIPISGFYSFLQGFVISIFGRDNIAYYNATENLFYIPIIIITVILLIKHLGDKKAFFVSLLLSFTSYNRVALIIPILLLLSLPKLISNRKLWFFFWFLSSFINGLYYPLFGVATCAAFLPLGIYQVYLYKKEGSFVEDKKKKAFWIFIAVSIILVVMSLPLLFGTAKHILALNSQTIYADGLSRFAQTVNDSFIPFIKSDAVRRGIFYILTFLLPIIVVLIPGILAMKLGGIHFEEGSVVIDNKPPVFICSSVIILCCIAYSFTFVRLDLNDLYSRHIGIVYAAVIMIIIIVLNNTKNKSIYFFLVVCIFILEASSLEGIWGLDDGKKLKSYEEVPSNYEYVEADEFKHAENCFMHENNHNSLKNSRDYIDQHNLQNTPIIGIDYFGAWYINEFQGMGALENMTVKGYGAAAETKKILENNDVAIAISGDEALNNYYLFNWLITSGKYYWSENDRMFHPVMSGMSLEDALANNKNALVAQDNIELKRIPSSWGESMYDLESIFDDSSVSYAPLSDGYYLNLQFENGIMGEDADFLALSLKNSENTISYYTYDEKEEYYKQPSNDFEKALMLEDYNIDKKVYVVWEDESGNQFSVNCYYEKGNLLIPLGIGKGWLLNKHSDITLYVTQQDNIIQFPEVNNIRLLKLRGIEDE